MQSSRKRAIVGLAALAVACVTVSAAAAHPTKVPAACNGLPFAHMGPLTGAAAVLGQEQLSWDRFGVAQFNQQHHTNFQLVEADDQLNAAQGSTVAQSLVSNSAILAVVGPAGSQVVTVAGPLFKTADLAMVSSSATDGRLSDGAFPTFFRVNANNDSQAPVLYLLLYRHLKVKKVMIVDDQSPDKVELANLVAQRLQKKGVTVDRESVRQSDTDFSALAGKIDPSTNAVLLSWQLATEGQLFAQQMQAQGKKAVIVGANGLYSPSQFTPEGGYVTSFAPDVRYIKVARSTIKAYEKATGITNFGTYGPPAYLAGQVVLNAFWSICSKGEKVTRASVVAAIRKTHMQMTILGTPLVFAKNGNSRYATFYVFQVKNGKYVLASTK